MTRHLEAIYENGVLRPLEPLALEDQQRVRVTVEDAAPAAAPKPMSSNPRTEEMRWIGENKRSYAGQWVAVEGYRLVAHGERLADVRAACNAAGVAQPLFARIPRDLDTPDGGW